MIEPKIRLSLYVPGAKMLSSQECDENPKENYTLHKLNVEYAEGNGKKKSIKKETLLFRTKNNRLVRQNINMSKEAYDYMVHTPVSEQYNRKINKKQKVWDTFSIDKRLRMYFDNIANDIRAVKYNYEILDD